MTNDIAAGSPTPDTPWRDGYVADPAVQAESDQRYAGRATTWSGQPNGALA